MEQKGFTLVEVILTIVLISILFATSSLVMQQGLNAYAHVSSRGSNTQDARFAMERMVQELLRVSKSGGIQNMTPISIAYKDDSGLDTDFHFNPEDHILYRGEDPLLNNVTSFSAKGYKGDNTEAAPGEIAQVRKVQLKLETLPQYDPAPLTLQANIVLRNHLYENFR